jgi:MFS transporter, PAT family, beta-lactamase induction signal transducer AmpG
MYKKFSSLNSFNFLKVLLYGLINGISVVFAGNTLNFWLASNGIDNKTIGLLSCVTLPQALKYLIVFAIERLHNISSIVSHYRIWMVISQSAIIITLLGFSLLNPKQDLYLIILFGFILSLSAVMQYIILNGTRIVMLDISQQGAGTSLYNVGYRIGMFITGAGVIYVSTFMSWSSIYISLAFIYFLLSVIINLCYKSPKILKSEQHNSFMSNFINIPIKKFNGWKNLFWIMIFIVMYQASDSMMMAMLNPFLLFKKYVALEIVSASKTIALIMVISGGLISGIVIDNIGIRKSLIIYSILHLFGYVLFIFLAIVEKNILYLYLITGYVAFTGGLATTACLTLISGIANGDNVTIIYSFLSSLIGLGWFTFPLISGFFADYFGWPIFFVIVSLIYCVAILIASTMPKEIYSLYKKNKEFLL